MVIRRDIFDPVSQLITQLLPNGSNIFNHIYIEEIKSLSTTLRKILPFTPIFVILSPILLPLVVSLMSITAWFFWVFASFLLWVLQLIYVLYQFQMIGMDLGVLTLLKTFAMLRSRIRRYRIVKSGNRGKEWGMKLKRATNFAQYQEINIEEPISSPIVTAEKKDTSSSLIAWAWQCVHRMTGTKTNNYRKSLSSQLHHKSDNFSTLLDASKDTMATHLTRTVSDKSVYYSTEDSKDEHKQKNFENELGMKGGLFSTTTSRLRDVRMEALSASREILVETIREEHGTKFFRNGNSDLANKKDSDPTSAISFLLTGVVKRNHLDVEDILIDNAQSIMECGKHRFSAKARNVILEYQEEVERCLDWIAESDLNSNAFLDRQESSDLPPYHFSPNHHAELCDRMNLLRKMKHNMGRSALMLSGGGAQALFHLGTIKALCESGLYNDVSVISGTSGGSFVACACAIKTAKELLSDVCVPHLTTDFGLTGEMKMKNIRLFPSWMEMCRNWFKYGFLVDSKEFNGFCEFYFKDITFEEAFQITGKHVCITVSASRTEAYGGRGAQQLLLNHISTPHVTLASAVAASSALPGLMAPAKLVTKNSFGKKEPFEVDGVEWIDGSVQADLPFKRISTLFNVSNYIVCQTNFHVLPFLRKPHHPNQKSFYWRAFETCEWDMRNRFLNLSRLGLFPKIFGQDISMVFKQKYHGNLTLVPKFTIKQLFGLHALVHPTVEHMEIYLQNGQVAAWPYLSVIKEMLRLETSIDRCISRLAERIRELSPANELNDVNDDMFSDTSSCIHLFSSHRETELLKEKVHSLELEVSELKRQLNSTN